jgi:carbamoyl-phosphate synthase large subunit
MPRRNDIAKILVIGSGPIVIGQSAEFDYSGTQACKALKAEGYEVVLVNSNPASIMTDPEVADRTYIEPLTATYLEEIIRVETERMDLGGYDAATKYGDSSPAAQNDKPGSAGIFALLPTVGGQTALNLAVELADSGVLERYGVELIGAKLEAIKKAEDRLLFKDAMNRIGLEMPKSQLVGNVSDGLTFAAKIGFPVVIRPSFTLGGSGGGIAYNREEMTGILAHGIDLSPVHECLIEESVLGWKAYRRLDHGGPGADADRPRVSEDEGRGDCLHPRDWRGDRRKQRAVRGEPSRWTHDHHRDEPASEPVERACQQSYRLSDCQDRRAPCRWIHAG